MVISRESPCVIVSQEVNKPLLFFHGTPFSLERTDKLWLFRLWYLADIFSKRNKRITCRFKKSKWQDLLSALKLELSCGNWKFGKLLPASGSLTASQYIMTFLMTSMVLSTNGIFECYIMKFVKIWKICVTICQYFPNDPCLMVQNSSKWQEHPKVHRYGFRFHIETNLRNYHL